MRQKERALAMSVKTIPAEEYVMQLLGGRGSITSEDIPLNNDSDYVMSLMIAAEYDYKKSGYRLEILDGSVERNGYSIPNIKIMKKS
jgi:hypothetical protein